ncbi:hypothetical protein Cgig2_025787 [Carnegiea gigantea]|uniref:Uncharacterized protein n=1 Tax=Carnegiea gigantea TaxID=171969 RepID=A0A9Q1JR14_9CARY|nr:hypothetical protein Cgig2_025787 [Carnegiea gigantea]
MSNVVVVGPEVDDDVLEGGGLEELDISLSDPDFELFFNDDNVTKNPNSTTIASTKKNDNDEDKFVLGIFLLRRTLSSGVDFFSSSPKCDSVDNNMAEVFNASIIEAEVNNRALYSSHAPSQIDRMIMIPTPQQMRSEPILPVQDKATVLTPLIVATTQAGQIVANRGGTAATIKQR